MDREDTLRRAERFLRQGRLDAAIEEYASVVEAYPKDWATANLLGDLLIRAGRVDRAVAQYARIAEQLAAEGFLSKAGALYKKILKITPQDEQALLRTAELSAQQGLLADARHVLHTLFQRRLKAGDRDGAARIARRLAMLDPRDVVGRLDAARMCTEIGDALGASDHLVHAGDVLTEQGRDADALRAWRESLRLHPGSAVAQDRLTGALIRQGDLDGALAAAHLVSERRAIARAMLEAGRVDEGIALLEQVLGAEPDHVETRLRLARALTAVQLHARARDTLSAGLPSGDARIGFALADWDLRMGETASAVAIISDLLKTDPAGVETVVALAASLSGHAPSAAFAAVTCAVDHLVEQGDLAGAIAGLERFEAAFPGHVGALERIARLCREAGDADRLYRAEHELTEALLANRQFAAAFTCATRLAALRPDVDRHQAQVLEARRGLGDEAASAPAQRHEVSRDADPLDLEAFAASLGLPIHADVETDSHPVEVVSEAPSATPASPVALDEAPRELDEAPFELDEAPSADEVIEVELVGLLDALAVAPGAGLDAPASQAASGPAGGDPPTSLDGVFRRMREDAGRDLEESEAMRAYDRAGVHYNEGRFDEAEVCLRRAGRDPILRFRASVMLAGIATTRGDSREAITWLERAAESPAPSVPAERALLYELGVALERAGESARALAVYLELNSMEPDYRDVADRIDLLGDQRASWPPDMERRSRGLR